MKIIPVLDLLDGQVVHAKQGQRAHYAPIQSQLCAGSHPKDILASLLKLYPFDTVYIADLNAIQFGHLQSDILSSLVDAHPQLQFWVDAGLCNAKLAWTAQHPEITWVIGTEKLTQLSEYQALYKHLGEACVLSLDFMPTGYLGPEALLNTPEFWPSRVICMTLARVGSAMGCDTAQLDGLLSQKLSTTTLYAAGGIKYIDDIRPLQQRDIAGVLVATALHQQTLTANEIASINAQ